MVAPAAPAAERHAASAVDGGRAEVVFVEHRQAVERRQARGLGREPVEPPEIDALLLERDVRVRVERVEELLVARVERDRLLRRRVAPHRAHEVGVHRLVRPAAVVGVLVERDGEALFLEPLQQPRRVWQSTSRSPPCSGVPATSRPSTKPSWSRRAGASRRARDQAGLDRDGGADLVQRDVRSAEVLALRSARIPRRRLPVDEDGRLKVAGVEGLAVIEVREAPASIVRRFPSRTASYFVSRASRLRANQEAASANRLSAANSIRTRCGVITVKRAFPSVSTPELSADAGAEKVAIIRSAAAARAGWRTIIAVLLRKTGGPSRGMAGGRTDASQRGDVAALSPATKVLAISRYRFVVGVAVRRARSASSAAMAIAS